MHKQMKPHVTNPPDLLLGDLDKIGTNQSSIITVEDKDASVLWSMNNDSIIKFWRSMFGKANDGWQVFEAPATNIITIYHKFLTYFLLKFFLDIFL